MTEQKKNNATVLAIFLTVLVDMIGVGIVIPVIPALFLDTTNGFFPSTTSKDSIKMLYGALIACYPIMQFFGAPILGALSDRYGRKPMLTYSLVGTIIGYILFAIAILNHNIWLLFFSRMLPGFMGGNVSIIMSAMADISTPETKTRNFGLVGAAFGIGFVIGPALGGVLSDGSISNWFNYSTPFFFTAFLAVLNLILVQYRFPETLQQKKNTPMSIFTGIYNIGKAFTMKELRVILSVTLLLSLGFAFFTQFFSVYLIEKFSYTQKDIGFLYAWIGLWLVITQGGIVRRMSGKIASSSVIKFSIIFLAFTISLLLLPDNPNWFFLLNALIAIGHGMTGPNVTTIVSNQIEEDRQGEILGIQQSMRSVGNTIPPLIAGWLSTFDVGYPLIASAIIIALSWGLFILLFKKN